MKINRKGCTRIVLLTKKYAFKFPNFLDGYEMFLRGLLANMQESRTWKFGRFDGLCPVIFSIPFGVLTVMPRAEILSREQFLTFDVKTFVRREDYTISAEHKMDSFGYLDGKIVAVDYGN